MSDDYSKDKLMDDMSETDPDWSKKNIKERQEAHGATPSEDDWSKDTMVNDGAGISPTTTTSSTTTTTTSASTTSSTATTAPPVISLVIGDPLPGGPPNPVPNGPWGQSWAAAPGPAHFDMVDDGTLDLASEADFIAAAGPATLEHLHIGAPSVPGGTYSAALITIRMTSANPVDVIHLELFDSNGAQLSAPGPHVFANTGPATAENIQIPPIPLVGPAIDPLITGGVLELTYIPGPNAGIQVFDIVIEWL